METASVALPSMESFVNIKVILYKFILFLGKVTSYTLYYILCLSLLVLLIFIVYRLKDKMLAKIEEIKR
jgi:hypothetical protein